MFDACYLLYTCRTYRKYAYYGTIETEISGETCYTETPPSQRRSSYRRGDVGVLTIGATLNRKKVSFLTTRLTLCEVFFLLCLCALCLFSFASSPDKKTSEPPKVKTLEFVFALARKRGMVIVIVVVIAERNKLQRQRKTLIEEL